MKLSILWATASFLLPSHPAQIPTFNIIHHERFFAPVIGAGAANQGYGRAVESGTRISQGCHDAMTDAGDPLERVLNLLLPRLLTRIRPNHALEQQASDRALKDTLQKIHAKLVEIMRHIMKRVRADQQCKLPCLQS
jgi:hypothetical protein